VAGDFVCAGGVKSAAVPHPDGSHRLLYTLECPDSWFEDFGRAQMIDGKARVELDLDYAAMVRTEDYHVFMTPEGDSKGLYVSNKSPETFEVLEQQGGTSNLAFSYRIVAKRKDIEARRLAEVALPSLLEDGDDELLEAPLGLTERVELPGPPEALEPRRSSPPQRLQRGGGVGLRLW
jgi:hypothetical protein